MEGNNNFNQNQYEANQTNNFNQEPIYQSNQVLEKKEGSNKILVVALVMSFIAVIALAYFYTDIKNEYIALKAEQINNPSSCVKPEEDAAKKEVKVEELIHIVTEEVDNKQFANIKIPRITGDTENINNINKKILDNSYKKVMSNSAYSDWILDKYDYNYYKGYYKYVIKNNIVLIVATIEAFSTYSGGLAPEQYVYIYDIELDKEIKLSEALEKLGYTDEDFLKTVDDGKCYENYKQASCTAEMIKKAIDGENENDVPSKTWVVINDNDQIEVDLYFYAKE